MAYENTRDGNYTQESILAGETVEHWSQMVTLTGHEGLALKYDDALERRAGGLQEGFKKACPDTLEAVSFGRYKIDERQAFGLYLACGRVPTNQGDVSEAAVIMIIQGDKDLYTLQYAVHGDAQDTPPPFVNEDWGPRVETLTPIRIMDRQ